MYDSQADPVLLFFSALQRRPNSSLNMGLMPSRSGYLDGIYSFEMSNKCQITEM